MARDVPTTELELPLQLEAILPKEVTIEKRLKAKLRVTVNLDHIEHMETELGRIGEREFESKTHQKRWETAKASLKECRETVEEATHDARAMELSQHPLGAAVPAMSKKELSDLRRSMEENGYFREEPVILFEGQVLDGWHRYTTALKVGVTPSYSDYKGDDPAGYVLARNIEGRRHLTQDQKSIAAAALAEHMTEGRNATESTKKAGAKYKVSASRVRRAAAVSEASPKLREAVVDGELSLLAAEKIAHDEDLLRVLEEGYDGKLADLVPEGRRSWKPQQVLLGLDVWQHSEKVYDADGIPLGEAYYREPEPPVTTDEIDAKLKEIYADTEDPTKKGEVRKALKAVDDRMLHAMYDSFEGEPPGEDMTRAKIAAAVAAFCIDWFASMGDGEN